MHGQGHFSSAYTIRQQKCSFFLFFFIFYFLLSKIDLGFANGTYSLRDTVMLHEELESP